MNLLKYPALIVSVVSLLGISDCDRTPPELTELEKLPPATQQGKYTFGCLVNGKALVVDNSLDVSAVYQFGSLAIMGTMTNGNVGQTLVFLIQDSALSQKQYNLDNVSIRTARFIYSDGQIRCDQNTDGSSENTGTITITKFDRDNLIISGTFELTVTQSNCPKYIISDGRFDLRFIP